ncbi:hypothetical protein BJX66DRAFT_15222 [Aspergillus keveii]|uniref:Uncharacterized protein n=1 Tax=Aspergillus keveii TaxID=714993 RepID=A0ABR4GIT5_9EURO
MLKSATIQHGRQSDRKGQSSIASSISPLAILSVAHQTSWHTSSISNQARRDEHNWQLAYPEFLRDQKQAWEKWHSSYITNCTHFFSRYTVLAVTGRVSVVLQSTLPFLRLGETPRGESPHPLSLAGPSPPYSGVGAVRQSMYAPYPSRRFGGHCLRSGLHRGKLIWA